MPGPGSDEVATPPSTPGSERRIATPVLLRIARDVYRKAVHQALVDAGFDDMPRDGSHVVGGLTGSGVALSDLIRVLGVSPQAGGQLVDSLVTRGYLTREVDENDRRRLRILPTPRAEAASKVIRDAVDRIDAHLTEAVGPEVIQQCLDALTVLVVHGREWT
jgi:DNA-binding MarR family transcriptional regulator